MNPFFLNSVFVFLSVTISRSGILNLFLFQYLEFKFLIESETAITFYYLYGQLVKVAHSFFLL